MSALRPREVRDAVEAALGVPVDSPEARRALDALGGATVSRPIAPAKMGYDPDDARSALLELPRAPRIPYGYPSSCLVRDGRIVSWSVASEAVGQAPGSPTFRLELPRVERERYRAVVDDGSWPPSIVERDGRLLFDLTVPQGHWDGRYRFPLTAAQAEAIQQDPLLYRELWDGLFQLCQSRAFLEDPAIMPEASRSLIDARCRAVGLP